MTDVFIKETAAPDTAWTLYAGLTLPEAVSSLSGATAHLVRAGGAAEAITTLNAQTAYIALDQAGDTPVSASVPAGDFLWAVVEGAETGAALTYEWYDDALLAGTMRSLDTTGLSGTFRVEVTATGASTVTTVSDNITVTALAAPTIVSAGTITSTGTLGKIGSSHSVTGLDIDTTGVAIDYQWLRDDVAISGAVSSNYVPVAADDGTTLKRRVTVANEVDSDTADTAGQAITYVAPVALNDGSWSETEAVGTETYDASPLFDATPGTYSLTATVGDAAINSSTGIITITTDSAVSGTITVRKTNSGGFDDATVTTEVTAPPVTAPTIAAISDRSYTLGSGNKTLDIPSWTTGTAPITYSVDAQMIRMDIVDLGDQVYGFRREYEGDPDPVLSVDWQVNGVSTGVTSDTFDNKIHLLSGVLVPVGTATNVHDTSVLPGTGANISASSSLYEAYRDENGVLPSLIIQANEGIFAYAPPPSGTLRAFDPATFLTNYTSLAVDGTDGVTRLQAPVDNSMYLDLSSINFDQTQGTMRVRYKASTVSSGQAVASFVGPTSDDRIRLASAGAIDTRFHVRFGGADQCNVDFAPFLDGTPETSVVAWTDSTTRFNGSKNGAAAGTADTTGTIPANIARLYIGNEFGGARIDGGIEELVYWPAHNSDADIAAMSADRQNYSAYALDGTLPTLIVDPEAGIYAVDTNDGSGLRPIAAADLIDGLTTVADFGGVDRLTIGAGQSPSINTSKFYLNPAEGTLVVDGWYSVADQGAVQISLDDGTNNNGFRVYRATGGDWDYLRRLGGATVITTVMASALSTGQRIAFGWEAGTDGLIASGNGAAVNTGTGDIPPGLIRLNIGANPGGTANPTGGIAPVLYYPARLANAAYVTASGA